MKRVLLLAFRGFGKSTITEEYVCLTALFQEHQNILILGENEQRALDRLRAIKYELEYNDLIREVFGEQVGATWGETRIVTSGGVCIQAHGRGQSLRGVKFRQFRPSLVILDDVEDESSVQTESARQATLRWLSSVVIPAMDEEKGVMRMLATPLRDGRTANDKSLPLRLEGTPEWTTLRFPVKHLDDTGSWQATWPEKMDMEAIDKRERELKNLGRSIDFSREYMLSAQDEASRVFSDAVIPPPSPVRSIGWRQPVCAFDPARTKNARSDYTGWAVWTWEGNKLVVWESGAERLSPSEIMDKIYEVNKRWAPIAIGVEQDGLEDFLLQPLRLMAAERGTIPLVPLRAPRGKTDFIRQLQPYFQAGEVEFIGPHDPIRDQLLAFPTGHDDTINALAYAIKMRGTPRYPDFGEHNVAGDLRTDGFDLWLGVGTKDGWTASALLAIKPPYVFVLRDWIEEGDVIHILPLIAQSARLEGGGAFRLVASAEFHEHYDTSGLRAAARRIPLRLQRSGDPAVGREALTQMLSLDWRARPRFVVADRATWTLRAMCGGAAAVETDMVWKPSEILMTAIESVIGGARAGEHDIADEKDRSYSYATGGRRYLTSNPNASRRG